MRPGRYPIITAANAMWSMSVTIDTITDSTGYTARMDIRTGKTDDTTLCLSLTTADEITLSDTADGLRVDLVISASQIDALLAAIGAANREAYYSLKLTPPSGADDDLIYLIGTFTITPTTTP